MLGSCSDESSPVAPLSSQLGTQSTSFETQPQTEIYFGPQQFVRNRGKPITEAVPVGGDEFNDFMPPFVLHVVNGDEQGKHRVSSARVRLNGEELLGPPDFSQQVSGYEMEVTLFESSVLEVELASKPGSYLTIWIEAVRVTPVTIERVTGGGQR
jgi:hypothetical protein